MKVEAVIILLLGAAVMISCTAIPNGKEVGTYPERQEGFGALQKKKILSFHLQNVLCLCFIYRTGYC